MTWYKNRGRVGRATMIGDTCNDGQPLTIQVAEVILAGGDR
jgi:hypothetical protein